MLETLPDPVVQGPPPTALAPMQNVTTLSFINLLGQLGAPDYFFTEYFRVHVHSTLEKHILAAITQNNTGRPIFAQLIGENLDYLERTVEALSPYPLAGIDLNLGCPAPKVYKKNVGGGLLRDPGKINAIFGMLRSAIRGRFTVKMRIGFEDDRHFDEILELIRHHRIDALSIHGRTVKQMYRGEVDYTSIGKAVARLDCPVFANGNITSVEKAYRVQKITGCHGLMVGRSAIRNPWIFRQIREAYFAKKKSSSSSLSSSSVSTVFQPTLSDLRDYTDRLWQVTDDPGLEELRHVRRMKKFLNFVGQGVDSEGNFLLEMRRAETAQELFEVCDRHLLENGRGHQLFSTEPFPDVEARPNHEASRLQC